MVQKKCFSQIKEHKSIIHGPNHNPSTENDFYYNYRMENCCRYINSMEPHKTITHIKEDNQKKKTKKAKLHHMC